MRIKRLRILDDEIRAAEWLNNLRPLTAVIKSSDKDTASDIWVY